VADDDASCATPLLLLFWAELLTESISLFDRLAISIDEAEESHLCLQERP